MAAYIAASAVLGRTPRPRPRRAREAPVGGLAGEPVDALVAEQPLGVGLARRERRRWCGRPAPTTMTGSPDWLISWQAAQSADTSSGPRSCISSMNTAMPFPTSAASPPRSVSSSTRSISMSPESARPRTAGTSMPGAHWSRSLRWSRPRAARRPDHAEDVVDLVRPRVAELANRLVGRSPAGGARFWSGGPRACRSPSDDGQPTSAAR